jgi:hypothetical protein
MLAAVITDVNVPGMTGIDARHVASNRKATGIERHTASIVL